MVKEWRRRGWYVKLIPEKESFRFGDGHICESKVALIIEVSLAGCHSLSIASFRGFRKVSSIVVKGNCNEVRVAD